MEKSSFFTSLNGDRKYKATDWAAYFANFIGNGVFPNPSSALRVNTNGDMTVSLSPGYAFINGYAYTNTDNLTLTIGPADAVLSRIDRVVLRCDFVNREITAKVKAGVFNSNPVPPPLQRDADAYELALCDIKIDPGIMNILQSKITDQVLNTELCGIVTQTVQTIDTTELFRKLDAFIEERGHDVLYWIDQSTGKWEKEFNTWFDMIKGLLNEDVAGQLANRIFELEEKVANGLKAENMQMADGNSVEKNVTDLRNDVKTVQRHKITNDNGTAILLDIKYDLDVLIKNGSYNGNDLLHAPKDDKGWWYIEVMRHTNDNGFTYQIATSLNLEWVKKYHRVQTGGVWQPWRSL